MAAPSPIRSTPPSPPPNPPRWQKPAAALAGVLLALAALLRLSPQGHLPLIEALGPLAVPGDGISWTDGLAPIALAVLLSLVLERLPRRPWSAALALAVLALTGLRYLLWRGQTLDSGTGLALAIGGLMLAVEVLHMANLALWLAPAPLFDPRRRRRQADQLQSRGGDHGPSVEFWVRTGHEEERLVRRALIACAGVEHPQVQVCVLDGVGRESVRQIAASLSMRYVALPGGSLTGDHFRPLVNAALQGCSSDLVALFDCRYMPFANFLRRTLGFFQDGRVAMVQTPITHFRSEYYNRNLGADQVMPGDRDLFFHYLQVVLDRFNSVQACGGSAVLRRSALASMLEQGGPAGARQSTTVAALQRRGETVVYLDENLSIGEAPHTFAAFLDQQLDQRRDQLAIIRAGGTLPQAHPLSPWPLLHQFARTLALLTPVLRIAFLLLPLFALLMGFPLMRATLLDYLAYGVPLLVLLHTVPSWLTDHHHSRFWSEVSEALTAVPSLALLLGLRGRLQERPRGLAPGVMLQTINLNMAWPFLLILVELITVLFLRYALPLLPGFENLLSAGYPGETLSLLWNLHNGWIMIVCLICAIDQPVRRQGDRIPIRRSGRLELESFSGGGVTCDLSESGAAFLLNDDIHPPAGEHGWLRLDDTDLRLPVRVVRRDPIERGIRMALQYEPLDAASTGSLLRLLYGGGVELPRARNIGAIDAFRSLIGGIWGANPVVRRY